MPVFAKNMSRVTEAYAEIRNLIMGNQLPAGYLATEPELPNNWE